MAALTLHAPAHGAAPDQEARQLTRQAQQLYDAGEYRQALPLATLALALREQSVGKVHSEVAAALQMLGKLQHAMGDFGAAQSSLRRSLTIREELSGREHPDTVAVLLDLGDLAFRMADYSSAEPLYRRALGICERRLPAAQAEVAQALNGLAKVHTMRAQYAQAETEFKRVRAIRERIFGRDHVETVKTINNLSLLYRASGDQARAIPLAEQVVAARAKALGPEHPSTAEALRSLALLYTDAAEFVKAEAALRRVLAIQEKKLGVDHPNTANTLDNLGIVLRLTGAYEEAERLHLRSIAIQQARNRSPLEHLRALGNLAAVYMDSGRYGQAEPICRRGLQLAEQVVGPEGPEVGLMLDTLGRAYLGMGQPERAEPVLLRSLDVLAKTRGPDHFETTHTMTSLEELYVSSQNYERALPLQQRIVTNLSKLLGPRDPRTVVSLQALARLYERLGQSRRALALLQQAQRSQLQYAGGVLVVGSEVRKRAYLASLWESTNTDVTFSVLEPSRDSAILGLTRVLYYKGRALDVMSDSVSRLRNNLSPDDSSLLQDLSQVASRLSNLTYQESDNHSSMEQLFRRQQELESQLASRSSKLRREMVLPSIAELSAAVPAEAALIEWLRYTPITADLAPAQPRYVAYILKHRGNPVAVDLGDAEVLDAAVSSCRAAFSDAARTEAKQCSASLYERVFVPLRTQLLSVRHLLIAPDGALNLLPVAALIDERGHYLIQKYEVSYLTSGRDLIRHALRQPATGKGVIVASPDYGPIQTAISSSTTSLRSQEMDRGNLQFRPLAGTALEAQDLRALLQLDDSAMLVGARATEANVKRLRAPRILHIASHGFFLKDQQLPSGVSKQRSSDPKFSALGENPLLRSGIALAGANRRRSGNSEDGILTALEVAQLDLRGTQLVVLSACDTGVGRIQNGEGVYGLRRALSLAGAQTQITSLWKVSDTATRTLMVDYYRSLLQGAGRSAALRDAQLRMLTNPALAHPYYWASLVAVGDWTPLPGVQAVTQQE